VNNTIYRTVEIRADLHEKLRKICKHKKIFIKDIIPEIIRRTVEKLKKKTATPPEGIMSTTLHIKESLWRKFTAICKLKNIEAFATVEEIIRKWVEKEKSKNP